jgi:hypothetical protein
MERSMDTLELVAVAVAVYRHNNNQVIKDDPSRNNRDLARAYLDKQMPPGIAVTDADRQHAKIIRDYFEQKVVWAQLSNMKLPAFFRSVADVIQQPMQDPRSLAQLVWAPKLHSDHVQQDLIDAAICEMATNSDYIGEPRHSVVLKLHIFQCGYNQNYHCYHYFGHDGQGNLVRFLNKNLLADHSQVRARVKALDVSAKYRNARVTVLNYVKTVS